MPKAKSTTTGSKLYYVSSWDGRILFASLNHRKLQKYARLGYTVSWLRLLA